MEKRERCPKCGTRAYNKEVNTIGVCVPCWDEMHKELTKSKYGEPSDAVAQQL